MASGLQAATAERPISQVESNMSRLDNAVEGLEHVSSQLISALTCACRSEPPMNETKATPRPAEVLVPLASNISTYTDRVGAVVAALRSARERLEL